MIISAVYFTPKFVADNLSTDGVLKQLTILKINAIQILGIAFGAVLLITAFYLIKPDQFSLVHLKISKIPFLVKLLFFVDLTLCFTHLLVFLLIYDPFILKLFDLGNEANIPAWYSSIKLFSISAIAALFAYHKFKNAHFTSRVLILLPILFLFLSADEIATIHEWIGYKTDFILLNTKREVTFFKETGVWMFIVGVPFILLFLVLMGSIKKYFDDKKYAFKKIMIGMMIFLTGALGVEIFSNFAENNFNFALQTFFEEFLEMWRVTLIFWGFYDSIEFVWHKLLNS